MPFPGNVWVKNAANVCFRIMFFKPVKKKLATGDCRKWRPSCRLTESEDNDEDDDDDISKQNDSVARPRALMWSDSINLCPVQVYNCRSNQSCRSRFIEFSRVGQHSILIFQLDPSSQQSC